MKIPAWKTIINLNQKLLNHLPLVNVDTQLLTTKNTCKTSFISEHTNEKRLETSKTYRPFPCHNKKNRNIITSNFMNPCMWKAWHPNSNPRLNLMPAKNHSRRLNTRTTENCLRNYNPPIVPGKSSYATVSKFGKKKKIFVVGDSHVKGIKRLYPNKELRCGKAFFRFKQQSTWSLFYSYSCRRQTWCCSPACWFKWHVQ